MFEGLLERYSKIYLPSNSIIIKIYYYKDYMICHTENTMIGHREHDDT